MRPGIRQKRLEAVLQTMAILSLEGLVAGIRDIPHQIKLEGEVGIRLVINILAHQLSTRLQPDHKVGTQHSPEDVPGVSSGWRTRFGFRLEIVIRSGLAE